MSFMKKDENNMELETALEPELTEVSIEAPAEAKDEAQPTAKKTKKKSKKERTLNVRRLRFGTISTAVTAAVVAGVVLLNVVVGTVADRFPISWDLSGDKVYTLSEDSVEIATSVKQEVEIIVFYDENEFENPTIGSTSGIPELDTVLKEFYNLLKQYKAQSNDKVTYTFIDPDQEPAKFSAYSQYDVESGHLLFLCGERHKTCTLDDLYSIDTSDYYTTGQYTLESNVEKLLGSYIHNLQSGNETVVQVLVGHEEDAYTINGLKSLYELNGYTFEELSITGSAEFNKDATVLLIPAPSKDYTQSEIKRVQEWLYNDGDYSRQLMVYVNYTADCPNLYEFLDVEYGIQVTDEVFSETDLNRLQNYNPLQPLADVPETDFTKNSVSTAKVFTPFARRLTTSLASTADDVDDSFANYCVSVLTYPESTQLIKLQDLEDEDSEAYNAKADEYPLSSMMVTVTDSYNNNTEKAVSGYVMVSGSAYLGYSDMIQNGLYSNEELLLDVANTITGSESAITISSKVLSEDTITFSEGVSLGVGLGLFTVGLPVILLVVCLIVFLRRKRL